MRSDVIAKLQQAMVGEKLDALVCSSPQNFCYAAGFVVPSHSLMPWRRTAAIIPQSGQCAIFTVDMEESTARHQAMDVAVHAWGEFDDRPMNVLASLLEQLGLSRGRIGVEMDFISAQDHSDLCRLLPAAQFVGAERFLAIQRRVKTSSEIGMMRRLSRRADEAIFLADEHVTDGSSELCLAGQLVNRVYASGAMDFRLLIVATGPQSVFTNVGPRTLKLALKDICRVEIFPIIDGYHAGVCRTAFVEKPPAHAESIWSLLTECKHTALEMIKPGESTQQIYETFAAKLRKHDLPSIAFLGHGIGVHLHEDPYLSASTNNVLEPGMVLGIEPLVYDTGYGFGMQNKDIVLVTEDGAELLSDFSDTDHLHSVV